MYVLAAGRVYFDIEHIEHMIWENSSSDSWFMIPKDFRDSANRFYFPKNWCLIPAKYVPIDTHRTRSIV